MFFWVNDAENLFLYCKRLCYTFLNTNMGSEFIDVHVYCDSLIWLAKAAELLFHCWFARLLHTCSFSLYKSLFIFCSVCFLFPFIYKITSQLLWAKVVDISIIWLCDVGKMIVLSCIWVHQPAPAFHPTREWHHF